MSEYFAVRRGSTSLLNKRVLDRRISYQALAILMTMLALPPGAPMGYRDLMGRGLGEVATRRAIAELEAGRFRWRFLARKDGRLRTITVVFDEPTAEVEAKRLAEQVSGLTVCRTSSGERNTLSNRAEDSTAQRDAARPDADSGSEDASEPPSRTAQSLSRPRRTNAQSTAAQPVKAQPSNDGFKEPYGSPPDQTEPVREPATVAGGEGVVGSGLEGLLDHDPEGVAGEDWTVLVECLPPAMRMIEPAAVSTVTAALRQRTTAGWRPDALRAMLAGNALPPEGEIRSLAGIVSYRIGQIPVQPPRPRKRSTTQATTVAEEPVERALASRMREEARAKGDPDADRPFTWWLEKYPPGSGSASESGLGAAS